MSKTGASPEFERKMQEIAEKTAHMVIPRSEVQTPITEPRYPAWTEEPTTPAPVIPAEAVEAAAKEAGLVFNEPANARDIEYIRTILEAAAPYMTAERGEWRKGESGWA